MVKIVFAYFDKEINATGPVQFESCSENELVEGVTRGIIKAGPEQVDTFKGKNLVVLGQYDDNKGFTLNDPQFKVVVDCDEIIQKVYGKYEQVKDN